MKANPWCTSMVAFATSSIFTNQVTWRARSLLARHGGAWRRHHGMRQMMKTKVRPLELRCQAARCLALTGPLHACHIWRTIWRVQPQTSCAPCTQAQPAGTGGSSTVEAADVSLGRLRVESSSDNIHARVELLKTMKLSLSKQATDAVKAVALQSAAPPKQPKQQQQQQQQGGEARRAGAKADEDSQDSGCDEAPDNAMQQLVAKAAAGADLYQALSEGRADVFPAALLLKTPRAPAAVKKEAGLTPGASSAASPAVDLDAMLECALQEAEALHPGGIDLRCAGWFEPDGALLGGCSNVALCDSPGSDELDLEAVELPSYLRRLLLNAPPPAELPAQCPVAHGDQVPVYVDPVQAIPAAPQPAVQPDVEMAPVLLDDASGDEETKHGARQQQQQQQPMDVVEDTPPAASDGSRGTGSGARQEDERAAPAQQPSSAPAAPRQPTKSVVPVLAKRRAKSYALVQQADAARDAATVATGAATAAKALSAHRAEPPKARLGVAKVPTLGRTLGPRRAMVMPANERSDDSPDDQIEEDEQEDKRVPAPSVPTSRPLPPRAGRVPVLSSRRAAVPAPSPAPAPASSHRNGGSDGVVDLVSSCDEDDFVVNAAARSTRRQLPPRSISPCSSLDDEPPAAARRGTAARRGGASAWRAPLVVPSLRPPPTGMPPPGKQRCRVAFNPESLLHKLPALSVPSQAPQAAVRAATRLVEESLGDAAHTLPPWPPRHLQGPAVSSDECDDDVELWDAVDAAAASMRAHAPPSMPAPTAKPTAPRPAAVDEEDELDDLDWDAADAAVDAARAQPQQQQHQHQQHRQPQQHQHQHQQPQWAGDPLVPRSALELLQQEQPGLVLGSPGAPTQSPAEEHAMPMVVEDSWDDDVPMFEGQQQPQPQPQPLPRPQPQLHPMALSSLQGQGLPAGPPRTALPKRAAVDAFSDDDVSCVLGSLPSEGASPQRADVIEDDHAAYAEAPTGGGAFRCLSPQPPGAMVVPVPRAAAHAPAHSGLSSQQERSAAAGNSARGMECKDGGGSVCGTEHEGGGGSARGMEYEDGGGGHVQVVEDDSSVDGDGEEDALVVDDDADMAGYSDDDDGDGDGWAAGGCHSPSPARVQRTHSMRGCSGSCAACTSPSPQAARS
jgi:hypothetical protein